MKKVTALELMLGDVKRSIVSPAKDVWKLAKDTKTAFMGYTAISVPIGLTGGVAYSLITGDHQTLRDAAYGFYMVSGPTSVVGLVVSTGARIREIIRDYKQKAEDYNRNVENI